MSERLSVNEINFYRPGSLNKIHRVLDKRDQADEAKENGNIDGKTKHLSFSQDPNPGSETPSRKSGVFSFVTKRRKSSTSSWWSLRRKSSLTKGGGFGWGVFGGSKPMNKLHYDVPVQLMEAKVCVVEEEPRSVTQEGVVEEEEVAEDLWGGEERQYDDARSEDNKYVRQIPDVSIPI